MLHPKPNDAKAHPAGRVLGEAVFTLRTDNAGRGMQTWDAAREGLRDVMWKMQYPASLELVLR